MAFKKLYEMHLGKVDLKLFRSVESKGLFIAVDKVVDGRTRRGPFLSEADVRLLVRLLARHKAPHPGERTDGPLLPKELPAEEMPSSPPENAPAQLEIQEALAKARNQPSKGGTITVLPSMPEYKYAHTCSICGCHAESLVRIAPGVAFKLCPACKNVHASTV